MSERDQREVPRYAQLTYTSYDRPAVGRGQIPGGWQVKDVTGELDESEQDVVRGRISTRLEAVVALPPFPTQEQIDAMPRRLHYGSLNERGVAYWHSVVAGSDASGRPGNVFVHVVVDRAPGHPPFRRPISLWRSTGWLTPYGAESVAKSELLALEQLPFFEAFSGAADLPAIVNFLLDDSGLWRIGVLCVLLDAVHHAIRSGGTVVLGVENEAPDRGARWISVVSALMSAPASSRFFFSTFERNPSAEDLENLDVHLVCVPITDLEDLELPESVVVIGEFDTLSLGELGVEDHHTDRGFAVTVTPWSVLAQTVLVDPETAVAALAHLDALAETGAVGEIEPAWALATLVLDNNNFGDAQAEAEHVLRTPRQTAVAAVGPVSIAKVVPNGTPGNLEERWFQFLEIIRTDVDWWRKPDGYAGISGRVTDPSRKLLGGVESVAAHLATRLVGEFEVVRFAELIMGAGLFDDGIEIPVTQLIDGAVISRLLDDVAASIFVSTVGPIDCELSALLRKRLVHGRSQGFFQSRPLGARVPRDVVEWLLPLADVSQLAEQSLGSVAVETPEVALASDAVLRLLADPRRPELGVWGTAVPLALRRLLWESESQGFAVTDATRIFRSPCISARDLLTLADLCPAPMPPRYLMRSMVSRGTEPEVARSIASLLCTSDKVCSFDGLVVAPDDVRDASAQAWAQLRLIDRWTGADTDQLPRLVSELRPALIAFSQMGPGEVEDLSPQILDRLAVLHFAASWYRHRGGAIDIPWIDETRTEALWQGSRTKIYAGQYISELVESQAMGSPGQADADRQYAQDWADRFGVATIEPVVKSTFLRQWKGTS